MPAAGAALCLAACGAPLVVERVVVVPTFVEREVVVERPVIVERDVIVETEVVVEKEVVVTRVVTAPSAPRPTPSTPLPTPPAAQAQTEPVIVPLRATLRAAISPSLAVQGTPDLGAVDATAKLTLEVLDTGSDHPARLLARAVAGKLPDLLIGVPGGLVTALDALEMLVPLDDALGAEPGFLSEMVAIGRRERGLVGMPISGYATYLLANRVRLDLNGVAEVGASYEAVGETARQLTDPETYAFGFGVVAGLPEVQTVAGSAGQFPNSERALTAWQWYADQWLSERVSPPPSAWDGQGAAGEALLAGRVALAIAHGRALPQLAVLPPSRRTDWVSFPLPAWPEEERRVPMAAAYIVAGANSDTLATDVAIALAGPAGSFHTHRATPAWTPALGDAESRLGLDLDGLLESRSAWTIPTSETATWRERASDLDVAVHDSLTLGRPVHSAAVALSGTQT